MIGFLKSMLGMTNRVEAADERIAASRERMADACEEVERRMRQALGLDDMPVAGDRIAVVALETQGEASVVPASRSGGTGHRRNGRGS